MEGLHMQTVNKPANRKQAKQRARQLRAERLSRGDIITHAEALERVAHELGYRDWNTASARLSNLPDIPFQIGDEVVGTYLKKAFQGKILAVRSMNDGGAFTVTVHFDEPVDVVEWESFSAFRQRVTATVSPEGVSWDKTSDGRPHLTVERLATAII
jgi:hypothetical protein